MVFEKKMIILSGEGKGVVLIEKNGLGVKFALRTFGVRGGLMAGIVTPDRVIVRDLPNTPDPSIVFYIDDISLDSLHFAVFGTELVLYGAIGKRMWTSNLMDILLRHSAKPTEQPVPLPSLPPIAEKPKILPMPDGTGVPQTRLELYGDDAISASNFYTGLDIDSTVPRLDAFLDGQRLLNDTPPPPTKIEPVGYSVGMSEATACAAESVGVCDSPVDGETEVESVTESSAADEPEPESTEEKPVAGENEKESENMSIGQTETEENSVRNEKNAEVTDGENKSDEATAAEQSAETTEAAAQSDVRESSREITPWWKRQAEYIRSLSTREVVVKPMARIKKSAPTAAKKIREVTFFERTKPDIDKLFAGAPRDTEISKLLDGEWVKVAFDGHAVSVGRLGDSVICYAVAGVYEKTSPLGSNAQWLPKVAAIPTGKGYWLIFQNLGTGEIIQ